MRGSALTLCALLSCGSNPGGPHIGDEVQEPSGLVRSRQHAGVFWTHGDSLNAARLFAVNEAGKVIARVDVDVSNVDWEDIATDDQGRLYIGDFGNNFSSREDLRVYRLREPDPASGDADAQIEATFRFRFPEQSSFMPREANFDIEALFVDGDELFVFSKHRVDDNTVLYRLPQSTEVETALEEVGTFAVGDEGPFAGMVTGADLHPDGKRLAVLSYHAVQVFEWRGGELGPRLAFRRLVGNRVAQVEAIAWDGEALVLVNEERAIFRMDDPFAETREAFPAP